VLQFVCFYHLLFVFPAFHQDIIILNRLFKENQNSDVVRIRTEVQQASKGNFRIECPDKKNSGMNFFAPVGFRYVLMFIVIFLWYELTL
jgi:hypothetical protein